MSIHAALNSPVFLFYLWLLLGLLAVAGGVLAILKWGLKKNVDHAWRAYLGWLVMVPLVLGCVFLGRAATVIFFTLAAMLAFKEFARATGLYRDWAMVTVVYLAIAACGVAALITDPFKQTPGWYGLFICLPVYVIAAILLLPILRNRYQGQLQTVSLAIVGFIYIGWMFGHLFLFVNAPLAYGLLLYLLLAVELNDVAAFTFGKLFGRHPLRSAISPRKTWEGALGALGVSLILPWLLRFSFPSFGPRDLILTGLIVGVGGQLGDLSISMIKRDLGIKDMGAAIPGHGGLLDRIDSLIYVAPLFLHLMMRFFHELMV